MKNRMLLILILCLFLVIFLIPKSITVVYKKDCKYKLGIIDANLSSKYDNVIYSINTEISSIKPTHGDKLISFVFDCQKNAKLYYYDASDNSGSIKTNNIIDGLNWMAENSVDRINLSLSNKVKHEELQSWIINHKNIRVYASYNNKLNSLDYPAMYNNVYATGCNPKINYKEIDIKYKNSNIIVLPNIFKKYKGNSYLSIISMLSN